MRFAKLLICVVGILAFALPALAQIPTGTLSGVVTDSDGQPLPGVTVEARSANLQGVRTAVSATSGEYTMPLLPPGLYKITFTLQGFQTLEAEVKLSVAQTTKLNATMASATLAEAITVIGSLETISTATLAASTLPKQLVDQLPIARDIRGAIIVAAGTSYDGPAGYVTISGSQSYENLWLVNGVVLNENVRQQALPLFIEDAIQETTTQTSGISAEYGRFAGGVITMITKSGGNQFSGSFRVNLDNPSWSAKRPNEAEPTDKTNTIYEATLGGFVVRDHLWFFGAGRDIGERVTSRQTSLTNIPFDQVSTEKRYEGKLTFSIKPEHRLIGSYTKIDRTTSNGYFGTIMDLRSVSDRKDPQELWSGNYTGVITDNSFVEAQYSKRDYTIGIGSGGRDNSVIYGTLLLDASRSSRRFWSPTFCGAGPPQCPDKVRNNEDYLLKGSYFLTTPTFGSHDLSFGVDRFEELNLEENHQSASDFRIYASYTYIDRDPIIPVFSKSYKGRQSVFYYQPQLTSSQGSRMKTESAYVNDKWRLNSRWTFNVGFRYDKNNARDSGGNLVSNNSRISPRLSASWDTKGDGDFIVNASASRYVTSIIGTGNVGDSTSPAGLTSVYLKYNGPDINTDPNNLVSTEEALTAFFNWLKGLDPSGQGSAAAGAFFFAQNPANWRYSPSYPGLSPVLLGSFASPYTDEYTIGAIKRLGSKGMVRVDYVHRKWDSFLLEQIDLTTGYATDPAGTVFDRAVVKNDTSGKLNRKYDGIHVSAAYRLGDRINLGGNYTLSWSKGNTIAEYSNTGPVTISDLSYPEYQQGRWDHPEGYLPIDARHRLRLFGTYDVIASRYHRLNVGLAQYLSTGTPYEAVGTVDAEDYVTNPGYKTPTTTSSYYFSKRGAYRLDDRYTTDVSVTYSFVPKAWGRDIEIYVKPEVDNVFNQQAVTGVDTQVNTAYNDNTLQPFNPFTDTPVEGVNWKKGTNFGKPTAPTSYQSARTFLLAVGIRF